MLFAEEVLQKYAAKKNNDIEDLESGMTPQAKHERELIRRYQQTDDFMALRELQSAYRGIINSSISQSGIASVMDRDTALQEANKAFRELVKKNYDLTKKIQPNTYIIGALPKALSKLKYSNRDFAVRKSDELTRLNETVTTAKNFLKQELGRDPSSPEIYHYIKDNFRTARNITEDKIKRIDALDRSELSGNVQIGQSDGSNGADYITLSDISNVDNRTPEEMYESQLNDQRIESIINKLPRTERRFIRNFYGIGEFKNNKASSLYQASTNNGMTYYEAKKVVDKFKQMLKDAGIM
jgi:hypothetical protein